MKLWSFPVVYDTELFCYLYCQTPIVSRTTSYEITLVRPSIRPPLNFLKIGSLFLSHTVLTKPDFFGGKKNGSPNLGPTDPNQARVFLEIAYDDTLRQCLTFSRDKTNEKKIGQIWAIFSSSVHQFSFNLHRMIAWNIV